jgi:hypothetical protein
VKQRGVLASDTHKKLIQIKENETKEGKRRKEMKVQKKEKEEGKKNKNKGRE